MTAYLEPAIEYLPTLQPRHKAAWVIAAYVPAAHEVHELFQDKNELNEKKKKKQTVKYLP